MHAFGMLLGGLEMEGIIILEEEGIGDVGFSWFSLLKLEKCKCVCCVGGR